MSLVPVSSLPDAARIWVFVSADPLTPNQQAELARLLSAQLATWTAHRRELRVAYNLLHNRFVIVAVDESATAPSGCSIDALFNLMRNCGDAIGNALVDTADIVWRSPEGLHAETRESFNQLARSGRVDRSTVVFDRTVESIGNIRNGAWEKTVERSWHARAFDFPPVPTA